MSTNASKMVDVTGEGMRVLMTFGRVDERPIHSPTKIPAKKAAAKKRRPAYFAGENER